MQVSSHPGVTFAFAMFMVFGGCATSPRNTKDAPRMPLLTFAGADSKIDEPMCVRITSAEQFESLYMRHLGEDPERFDPFYNPHGVPVIDFDRCIVLAVYQGPQWNTAGVYVHSIIEQEQRLIVRIHDRTFQTFGPDGGGKRGTPFGIFVLPRTEKALVVEQDVRTLKNEPPKWKEKPVSVPFADRRVRLNRPAVAASSGLGSRTFPGGWGRDSRVLFEVTR